MTDLSYITGLIFTLVCLGLLDLRFKLCIFADQARSTKAIFFAWIGLLIWDILGIWQGVFFSLESKYSTEVYIVKNLPIEEPFALLVIAYTPLLLWTYLRLGKNA